MPNYLVFWDEIAARIRIHRADCGACKYSSHTDMRISKGRTTYAFNWEPADTYAKASEIVVDLKHRKPAFKMSVQTDYDLCHPEHHNETRPQEFQCS